MTESNRADGLAIIPIALLVHNVEEGLAVRTALPQIQIQVSRLLDRAVKLPSVEQYYVALAILTMTGLGLLLLALAWDKASYGLVVIQAVMTLNILTHILSAVSLRGYAPGIVTALLVELPTSVVVYLRLSKSGWMTRTQWTLLPLWAILLHGPGLLGLLAIVRGI